MDNGGEFINQTILTYCQAERMTFTRGRPELKEDQCHVEQKNGAVVRQFVGFERLMGEQAYRHLRELYRAVRLYVNCFQPSMKLLTKHDNGERVRRVYDPAKTPLERLLFSGILPEADQDHLREVVEALDPVALDEQIEQLHMALLRSAWQIGSLLSSVPPASIQRFAVERCLPGSPLARESVSPPIRMPRRWQDELPGGMDWLDWPRTSRDPFAGAWERVLALVMTHPEWSGSELFREMQCLFPGRYRPSHQGTLQLGLRKIRARLLSIIEEPWPEEVIQTSGCASVTAEAERQEQEPSTDPGSSPPPSKEQAKANEERHQLISEEAIKHLQVPVGGVASPDSAEGSQQMQCLQQRLPMTIEGAIHAYFQEQEARGRRSKTLEWHRTALRFFQRYLVHERHLRFVSQITEREVRGWMAFLRSTPSSKGTSRSVTTIATYVRSAHAFCRWLLHIGALERPPFVKGTVPKAERKAVRLLETEAFERLLLAC